LGRGTRQPSRGLVVLGPATLVAPCARHLTIRSSGPLRRAVELSCGTRQRPLSSGVRPPMLRSSILSPMFLGLACVSALATADEVQDALPVNICDVNRNASAYSDRPVRFHAVIESDTHTALLLDPACSRGLRFNLKHAEPRASAGAIEKVVSG